LKYTNSFKRFNDNENEFVDDDDEYDIEVDERVTLFGYHIPNRVI
jgi:hypothetical protein